MTLSHDVLQLIEICDLSNSVVKSIKQPMQTNEIFLWRYGEPYTLLHHLQHQKTIAEVNSPAKYVVWSTNRSLVALMSKACP